MQEDCLFDPALLYIPRLLQQTADYSDTAEDGP